MIKAKIEVKFLTAEEGGRSNPIFDGYRPNFVFGYSNGLEYLKKGKRYSFIEAQDDLEKKTYNVDGVFKLVSSKGIFPGSWSIVCVEFDCIDKEGTSFIKSHSSFLIREAARVIAYGEVVELK